MFTEKTRDSRVSLSLVRRPQPGKMARRNRGSASVGYHHPRHQPLLGRERKGRRQKKEDKRTEEMKGEGREGRRT